MIRQTSIEAYNNLVKNGVLAEKNRIVYEHLFLNGATTQKKTERFFNDRTYTLRPRFAQLEKMGLIKSIYEEVCKETGRKNIVWDVTERVNPLELRPVNNKRYRCEVAIDSLRRLYLNRVTASDDEWREVANLIKDI